MISKDAITRYTQLGMLILISLALIFWPYVKIVLPNLGIEQTLGFFVAIASGMFLYFDTRLSDAIRGPTQAVTSMSLNDCFNDLSKHHKHIEHLRIFALSAARIHPLFSSSDMRIANCDILLRGYTESELSLPRNAGYQRHIEDVLSEWEKEKARGKINNLYIGRYCFMPTEYCVIIDDKAMIIGMYQPTSDGWGDVLEPFFVQGSTAEGAKIIKRHTARFDQMKILLGQKREG